MAEDERFRDFDEDDDPLDDEPAPTFKLGGQTFTLEREIPAAASRKLKKDRLTTTEAVDVIRESLIPEDMDRFEELIESKETRIPSRKVTEVFIWLNEVYSGGRPTRPSAHSSNGRKGGRATSKAASSSQD